METPTENTTIVFGNLTSASENTTTVSMTIDVSTTQTSTAKDVLTTEELKPSTTDRLTLTSQPLDDMTVKDTNTENGDSGPPIGGIVGGVLAGVVILVLVVVLIFCIFKRYRKSDEEKPGSSKVPGSKASAQSILTLKKAMNKKRATIVNAFKSIPPDRKASIDIEAIQYAPTDMPSGIADRSSLRNSKLPDHVRSSKLSSVPDDDLTDDNPGPETIEVTIHSGIEEEEYSNNEAVGHLGGHDNMAADYDPEDEDANRAAYHGMRRPTFEQFLPPPPPEMDQEDYMNSWQIKKNQIQNQPVNNDDDIIPDSEVITHNRGRRPTFDDFGQAPSIPVALSANSKTKSVKTFDSIEEIEDDQKNIHVHSSERRPSLDLLGIAPPAPQFEQEEYVNIAKVASPKQKKKANLPLGNAHHEDDQEDYMSASNLMNMRVPKLENKDVNGHDNHDVDDENDDVYDRPCNREVKDLDEQEDYVNMAQVQTPQQNRRATSKSTSSARSLGVAHTSNTVTQDETVRNVQYATPSSLRRVADPGYQDRVENMDNGADEDMDEGQYDGHRKQSDVYTNFMAQRESFQKAYGSLLHDDITTHVIDNVRGNRDS